VSDQCNIAGRRAELVGLLTAACAPIPVCDDIPDLLTGDVSIVVTWAGTRWSDQWLHTFDVLVIPTDRSAPAFFAGRDAVLAQVLTQLNAAEGIGRPTAGTRTVPVAGTPIERCAVVTVTATDNPISTGG
jgi:hypothetical protein